MASSTVSTPTTALRVAARVKNSRTLSHQDMRDALNGVGVVLDRARAELHSGKYSSRQVKSVLAASHATADGNPKTKLTHTGPRGSSDRCASVVTS